MEDQKPQKLPLEIVVTSARGAATAVSAGADRLELCEALEIGGITSNPELVAAVLNEAAGVGVHALIRPRGGNFVYSTQEVELMLAQARRTASSGVAGLVVGALDAAGNVDVEIMRKLIDEVRTINRNLELTFHPAIDDSADPVRALSEVIELGVTRVLTSGGAPAAPDGLSVLARMVQASAGKIQVMAGGGMRIEYIEKMLAAGIDAVHFSAKAPSPDASYMVTDGNIVAALRDTIDSLAFTARIPMIFDNEAGH